MVSSPLRVNDHSLSLRPALLYFSDTDLTLDQLCSILLISWTVTVSLRPGRMSEAGAAPQAPQRRSSGCSEHQWA